MPLIINKETTPNSRLFVWEITEGYNEIIALFTKKCAQETPNFKSQERIKQWCLVRVILNDYNKNYSITYNEHGKPIIQNAKEHISISHTSKYVVILMNKMNSCGVDIESVNKKVFKIKNRFLSTNELLKFTTIENLVLAWCSKEALFKYYGKPNMIFKEHFIINGINEKNIKTTIVHLNKTEKVILHYQKINDHVLVFTS